MTRTPLLHRIALAVALALPAASLVAIAGEPRETTEIEVVNNGVSEKVSIADLKAGETRQLYSEAGTLVTATRTAESLELDIGGDKTSIRLIEPAAMDDAELAALVEAHGGHGDGHKRVVRIHREGHVGDAKALHHGDGHRKVIVLKGDADAAALEGGDVEVLVKGLDDGQFEGKKVIVKRKLVSGSDTGSN